MDPCYQKPERETHFPCHSHSRSRSHSHLDTTLVTLQKKNINIYYKGGFTFLIPWNPPGPFIVPFWFELNVTGNIDIVAWVFFSTYTTVVLTTFSANPERIKRKWKKLSVHRRTISQINRGFYPTKGSKTFPSINWNHIHSNNQSLCDNIYSNVILNTTLSLSL